MYCPVIASYQSVCVKLLAVFARINNILERCDPWPHVASKPAIVTVTSFAIELATSSVTDVCYVRTDTLPHLIYKDYSNFLH